MSKHRGAHRPTLVARYKAGELSDLQAAFDEELEAWHAAETAPPVWEWMGLTEYQYRQVAEKASNIEAVLADAAA